MNQQLNNQQLSQQPSQRLQFLKLIVQAVAVEMDENGRIIGERLSDPKPLYTEEQIMEFLRELGMFQSLASQVDNGKPNIETASTFSKKTE